MKKALLILLSLTAMTVSSCSDNPGRPIAPPDEGPPLASGIRLTLYETLPAREIHMIALTEVQYPCSNFGIATALARPEGRFEIDFSSIAAPEICLTAPWFASSEFSLGAVPDGRHPLRISGIAGNADLLLDVGPLSYGVVGRRDPGIRFEEYQLRRVPEGLIWGYFNYYDPAHESEVRTVLAELSRLGARAPRLETGVYHTRLAQNYRDRFRVLPSGALENLGSLGNRFHQPFALRYSGDLDQLRDVVYRAGSRHDQDGFLLRLFTSGGDVFLSWHRVP